MIAPGVSQGFHVPRALPPFLLGILAIVVAVLAWGALTLRHTANRGDYALVPAVSPASVRSVAYVEPLGNLDVLYVRGIAADSVPRRVADFPYTFQLHARGLAAPTADRIAVLHVTSSSGSYARLDIVSWPGGTSSGVDAEFDYLSALAWAPDGSRLAGVRSTPPDETGQIHASVLEVDAATRSVADVARFDGVFEVAPVGYSVDGERLFIVVVDQAGSTLWAERAGKVQRVASLSPGRTLFWALSPDGSRLAYVDVLGAGERAYAGRTLAIATGAVTDTPSFDDQLGAAWLPGSEVAAFGGPGGSVRLSAEAREAGYVIPERWSPDGSTLVATIYPASGGGTANRSKSIEIFPPQGRIRLTNEAGAIFLGWVRDLD